MRFTCARMLIAVCGASNRTMSFTFSPLSDQRPTVGLLPSDRPRVQPMQFDRLRQDVVDDAVGAAKKFHHGRTFIGTSLFATSIAFARLRSSAASCSRRTLANVLPTSVSAAGVYLNGNTRFFLT